MKVQWQVSGTGWTNGPDRLSFLNPAGTFLQSIRTYLCWGIAISSSAERHQAIFGLEAFCVVSGKTHLQQKSNVQQNP
jgi:hypothetical protein